MTMFKTLRKFIKIFPLVAFVIITNAASAVVMNAGDYAILMNIYNNTGGANWTNKTNWGSTADFATSPWYGIDVDASGRVNFINLPKNNLTGTLPIINGLTELWYCNLSNNKISGTIPSLTGLTKLQQFYIGQNLLTGTIPTLSGLTNLSSFVVTQNQLTGSIPSLDGLTSLTYFGAANNKLTGITNFAPLTSFLDLWINNNNINYTAFDNVTDPLKTFFKTGNSARYAPQNVLVILSKSRDIISTNLAEGSTPANYTYTWYKGTAPSGSAIHTVVGNNSVDYNTLLSKGVTGADDIYVVVTHNHYTISSDTYKNIMFTSNQLSQAMPVVFSHINATNESGMLVINWATSSETNNDHFDIEGSADGKVFSKIATVQSKAINGNSAIELNYGFSVPFKSTTGILGIGLLGFIALGIFTFSSRKRSLYMAVIISLFYCSVVSCSKTDFDMESKIQKKFFIRIAQIDKDGTKVYSKVVQVVNQ